MRLLFLFLLLLNTAAVAQTYTDPNTKEVFSHACASERLFRHEQLKKNIQGSRETLARERAGLAKAENKNQKIYWSRRIPLTERGLEESLEDFAALEKDLKKHGCLDGPPLDVPPLPKGRLSDTFKALIISEGYRCDSVSWCCPPISWHEKTNRPSSYKMTCDNNEYEYKIEARGGRWIAEKLK